MESEDKIGQLLRSSKLSEELKESFRKGGNHELLDINWTRSIVVLLSKGYWSEPDLSLPEILAIALLAGDNGKPGELTTMVPGLGQCVELTAGLDDLFELETCPLVLRIQGNRIFEIHGQTLDESNGNSVADKSSGEDM